MYEFNNLISKIIIMSLTLLLSSICNKDKNKCSNHLEVHLDLLLMNKYYKINWFSWNGVGLFEFQVQERN